MSKLVIKRSGLKEPYDARKVNKPVVWACEGVDDVCPSEILMRMEPMLSKETTTKNVHKALIRAAQNLITEETPNYQYPAARLLIFDIRKQAYGTFIPPTLKEHLLATLKKRTNARPIYDDSLYTKYSDSELDELNVYIRHEMDMQLPLISARMLETKYLAKNRNTGEIFESPQMAYMLIGMALFINFEGPYRLSYVKRLYDGLADGKISLPTPIMAGARTPLRQFSSCVVIDIADNLSSISGGTTAAIGYIAQRAGIGANFGRIRSIGSPIRDGEAVHSGVIPFLKLFNSAVGCCSQGGVRDGSATVYYPIWNYEFEALIQLKNNKGVEETRVRTLDYGVQLNGYFYKRMISGKNISLFSTSDVPGLYEAFFKDQELFAELYEKYEADLSIPRREVKASEAFLTLAIERSTTARIYIQHVDHCNDNSPFIKELATIYLSNLCLEIALPTKPIVDPAAKEGEIALCTLAAINVGELNDLDEIEALTDVLVNVLNALLDYQDYPVEAGRNGGLLRRSLGIGITGFATYLAKLGLNYSHSEAPDAAHRLMESIQYYGLQASALYAERTGTVAPLYNETTYSQGIMPIDRYNRNVDNLTNQELIRNWSKLRELIKRTKLANSTITALMPCETSSAVNNSINGIEPPRGVITYKGNKDAYTPQVVPYSDLLTYEYMWDMPSSIPYLTLVAVMQKFVDQSISANVSHDPGKEPDGKTSIQRMLNEFGFAYKHGIKTLYYHNTRDGNDQVEEMDQGCAGGACKI